MPHTGHAAGICHAAPDPCAVTPTILGITSPARSISTRSPTFTPSRAISSRLCSVMCSMVTPETCTGATTATGVSAPVRPTCTWMSSTTVLPCRAGNLNAMAPARRPAALAESLLQREAVHLDHAAVHLEGQLVAAREKLVVMRERGVDVAEPREVQRRRQAERLQRLHRLAMPRRRPSARGRTTRAHPARARPARGQQACVSPSP